MRISDWSSDVCSSDLVEERTDTLGVGHARQGQATTEYRSRRQRRKQALHSRPPARISATVAMPLAMNSNVAVIERSDSRDIPQTPRSEEHTSELQSLMRISYAVFCLKKKKKHTHKHT